jgi:3-hydroxyisobutyrate dehydrogenase-like beta-hydroxyacid dehydrogenase
MPIRAAIVGLGRWGRSLVASVQGKGAELSFVRGYTRTRTTAEDFCRAHGVPLAGSYEELLADPEIDAVVLATPHSLHESQIIAAAAAGRMMNLNSSLPGLTRQSILFERRMDAWVKPAHDRKTSSQERRWKS